MSNEILKNLLEGNKRYYSGKSVHPNNNQETRNKLIKKQTPVAIVVSCSDSRAPVEVLFDVGIGDLFVIRSAGHVLTESEMASIEYGIEHLNVKLLIVMGHSSCGAVTSALNHKDEKLSPNMSLLINRIKPAIEKAKKNGGDENLLEKSINCHVHETINYIKQDKEISKLIDELKVDVVAAKYNIENGKVEKI